MNQTIIVMCGPDRCGKTEIARDLSRRLGVKYFKARGEKANFRGDGRSFVNELLYADPRQIDLLEQLEASVVMDRGFPCEYAYSRVFGRTTDYEALAKVDEEYARLGAVIVLCVRSSYEGLVDDDRPDLITPQNLLKLEQQYVEFLNMSKCKSLILNVDDEDLIRECTDITTFLARTRRSF